MPAGGLNLIWTWNGTVWLGLAGSIRRPGGARPDVAHGHVASGQPHPRDDDGAGDGQDGAGRRLRRPQGGDFFDVGYAGRRRRLRFDRPAERGRLRRNGAPSRGAAGAGVENRRRLPVEHHQQRPAGRFLEYSILVIFSKKKEICSSFALFLPTAADLKSKPGRLYPGSAETKADCTLTLDDANMVALVKRKATAVYCTFFRQSLTVFVVFLLSSGAGDGPVESAEGLHAGQTEDHWQHNAVPKARGALQGAVQTVRRRSGVG